MSSYTNLPLIDAFEAQRMVYKARYSDSKNKSTIILSQKPLFFTILNDVSDKNITLIRKNDNIYKRYKNFERVR